MVTITKATKNIWNSDGMGIIMQKNVFFMGERTNEHTTAGHLKLKTARNGYVTKQL